MENSVLILDTHTLLWFLCADPRLGPEQIKRISNPQTDVFVSAISAYEVMNKIRIGKLPHGQQIAEAIANLSKNFNYIELPVTLQHAQLAGGLPSEHRDPFDRILAAQSMIENMPIMTVDVQIKNLGAAIVW